MQGRTMSGRWLVLLLVLALPLSVHGVATAQSVVINGIPLITSRTPVTMAGSMLLPMRDVFEALQSEVKWFASEQKVMAIRGQTTVELWLGRTTATINGVPMQLPVAPQLLNGSTYVPLRFPAEAFGGSVEWQAATRTALITIPPVGSPTTPDTPTTPVTPTTPTTPVTPTEPTTPTEPPAPQPTTVEGTLVQVITNPASIVISVSGTGLAQAIPVDQATVITRHADGQAAAAATLADAQPGDYAQAVIAPTGVAQSVDLSYGETQGDVAGISENSLLLKDNQIFQLSPTVKVVNQANKNVALSAILPGTPVVLRYQPTSRVVWRIIVTTTTTVPTTPTTTKPQIVVVGVLNDSPILKAGDVLRLQLQGTPGGTATATLGEIFRDLPMAEQGAGVYQAEFMVPPKSDAADLALVGNLTVNRVKATPVTSPVRITLDSTPPRILDLTPANGAVIHTSDTVIEARFDAGTGTPVNPAGTRLYVDNKPAYRAVATEEKITYEATNLPQREIALRVRVADMAGNTADKYWRFTVGTLDAMVIAASHNAPGPLTLGDELTVTLRCATPGGTATFDIGDLRQGLPLQRVGQTDVYRGKYTVRAGDKLDDGVVTVHYRDPAGHTGAMEVPNKLDLNATLPTVMRITDPATGSKVGDTIIIRGEAPPRARVRVTITYKALAGVITGQLWQGTVTASALGLWQTQAIASNTGLLGKADEYSVKAEHLDAADSIVRTKWIKLVK
jgi:hypothetical protein